MSLTCYCQDDGDFDWYWWEPNDYKIAPERKRRARCSSCHEFIENGATIAEFGRTRYAKSQIEERIFGEGGDAVELAPAWLCERCADLYFSLTELGFCVDPQDDMRELVREYADMQRREAKS